MKFYILVFVPNKWIKIWQNHITYHVFIQQTVQQVLDVTRLIYWKEATHCTSSLFILSPFNSIIFYLFISLLSKNNITPQCSLAYKTISFKINAIALMGVAQLAGCRPARQKVCWFDFQLGHMTGLQVRSLVPDRGN